MLICANCFNDKLLQTYINSKYIQIGECTLCNKPNVKLIEAEILSDFFIQLFDLYDVSNIEESLYLHQRLQSDWKLFNNLSDDQSKELLREIIHSPSLDEYLENKWILKGEINIKEEWDSFSEEIKHQNRFFPKSPFDIDTISGIKLIPFRQICSLLENKLKAPQTFYRSRINKPDMNWTNSDLKKPFKEFVTGGRANPRGIPYLYLADDKKTAIAEVRPAKGQYVTVGFFKLNVDLNIVHFRQISPFEYIIDKAMENIEVLSRFNKIFKLMNDKLSEPIDPLKTDLEYLPTQYICEKIKSFGYDGVGFQSAMAKGINYAIFNDEDKLHCYTTRKYYISELTYDVNYRS
jgi:hypothetical protein